jgi:cyclopropane-fatty-acyl-phospholipid synthase
MSIQTLSQSNSVSIFSPTQKEGRVFLDALRHIDYGKISIVTPENNLLEFAGPKSGPSGMLRLRDWGALDELVGRGEVGFAEAYIDERWDSPDLAALLTFALVNTDSLEDFFHGKPIYALWLRLKSFLRHNSLSGSKRNIMAHYDLGNDFYSLWLDESMTYSCALFAGNTELSLEEAQQAKYTRILSKIDAKPGDHVLEIGCGWGGFAIAAARTGLRVTAVTISPKQAEFAQYRIKRLGLDSLITIVLKDYREIQETFDHIVSIGMFEHVGESYWPIYFRTIKERLRPGGTAMVQSITLDDVLFEELHGVSGFIEQYIFPGGMLPSKSRFKSVAAKEGLVCREMFGFGQDYARTLEHWLSRFEAHKSEVIALGYDKPFLRLWRFYLASCIASFRSKRTDVMQVEITHTKDRMPRPF